MAKDDSEIKEAMDVLYNISSDEELRRLIDLREAFKKAKRIFLFIEEK